MIKRRSIPIGKIRVFDVYISEVGFILGMVLSDGNERFKRRQLECEIRFYNTNNDYIKMVKEAFERLELPIYIRKRRKGEWCLSATSALLYLVLKQYDKYVAEAPDEVRKTLLKGLWFGDGHIGKSVEFINTDLKLIRTVSKLLRRFRVKHNVWGPYKPCSLGKKPIYEVYVRAQSRQRFLKLIGSPEPQSLSIPLLKHLHNLARRGWDSNPRGP